MSQQKRTLLKLEVETWNWILVKVIKKSLLTSQLKSTASSKSPPQWYRLIEAPYKNLFTLHWAWLCDCAVTGRGTNSSLPTHFKLWMLMDLWVDILIFCYWMAIINFYFYWKLQVLLRHTQILKCRACWVFSVRQHWTLYSAKKVYCKKIVLILTICIVYYINWHEC